MAAPYRARIVVDVGDSRATPEKPIPLPVRVVVSASDGTDPDGSGRSFHTEDALDPLRDCDDFRLLMIDPAFPAEPFAH